MRPTPLCEGIGADGSYLRHGRRMVGSGVWGGVAELVPAAKITSGTVHALDIDPKTVAIAKQNVTLPDSANCELMCGTSLPTGPGGVRYRTDSNCR
jgi:hypothetical protein